MCIKPARARPAILRSMKADLDPVFSAVAAYFAVLAEPARLKIMNVLCAGERGVSEIVADTGLGQSNVSRHLALMYRHGILARRRDGKQVHYRVADPEMPELCRAVCTRIADGMDAHASLKRNLLKLMPEKEVGS